MFRLPRADLRDDPALHSPLGVVFLRMGRTLKVVLVFEQRQIILVLTLVAWIPCLTPAATLSFRVAFEPKDSYIFARGQNIRIILPKPKELFELFGFFICRGLMSFIGA